MQFTAGHQYDAKQQSPEDYMTKDQTGHRPEHEDLDRLQKSMGHVAQEEALDRRPSANLDQMQTAMGSAAQW
jgi:hypothetical protein